MMNCQLSGSSSDTSMTSLVTILDKYIAVGLYIVIALLINETRFCRMHVNNDLAYINCVSDLSEYNHFDKWMHVSTGHSVCT